MPGFRNIALWGMAPAAMFMAAPACAQAEFTGADEEAALDCGGGAATIVGSGNVLTITGACTRLTITGAGNRVTVDLARISAVHVEGADNQIQWRAPGTAKPRLAVTGAGNRISRLSPDR
ncbi:hypothetical protein FHS95_001400 [Sphingomonas naasensis]|uniref:DUF3060 domain-containing protein n=1 Tax=Sphingomonas naasensis TaxID=1344951 RepID=A0A4S1WDJ8_9SPHN|nr:DUF3060 domain-containing protein [Sphingomonas naasensis]NIJ19731.1 hypothetical protein [Sphingomonas naasensis]TGX40125.1 DUF3060 domain-containing protein [Sphingomonas naasensis]